MIALKKLFALILIAALLTLAGCTVQPAPTPTQEPEPTPTPTPFSPVWTDWSKLEPYEPVTALYTFHAGYCGDGELQARDDYGPLLVYIGKYATMEMYVEPVEPFYGLITDKGELVTDPVYSDIYIYDDFLMLYRGDPDGVSGGDTFAGGTFDRTVAAPDGSWVLELDDEFYVGCDSGLLTTAKADGTLIVRNASCEIVAVFDGALFAEQFGDSFTWGEEGGPYIYWTKDGIGYADAYSLSTGARVQLYLDISEESVSDAPPEGMPEEFDWSWYGADEPEQPVVEGCSYLDTIKDYVTGTYYYYGYYREKPGRPGRNALFDRDGELICYRDSLNYPYAYMFEYPRICAGLISSIENDCWCYREIDGGELVFRYPMRTNSD